MNKWTRWHTLIAGSALIVLTNAVALTGAWRNRAGEPDSVLLLSQRELRQPYSTLNHENSGMALTLSWRVADLDTPDIQGWYYASAGGAPTWLDEAKLQALGFDSAALAHTSDDVGRTKRWLSREVLLVLELDGPAYQRTLERIQRSFADQEAKRAGRPGDKEFDRQATQARDWLKREEAQSSRLFVVDAGVELSALRAKYPDRGRYAIVRGQVRPMLSAGDPRRLAGYIESINIDSINVPFEYRDLLGPRIQGMQADAGASSSGFTVKVAFGQRLEPWISSAEAAPK